MRKFIDLINEALEEAPLGDFDVLGDRNAEHGSFSPSDQKAFNNPKWLKKVESHFSRVEQKINIYLYNAPEGKFADGSTSAASYSGRLYGTERAEFIKGALGVDYPRDEAEAINFYMADNEGADKFSLTPWILAHRLSHALLESRDTNVSDFIRTSREVIREVQDNLSYRYDAFFTFKSAENVTRSGELIVDLLTQYIVQGRIKHKLAGDLTIAQKGIARKVESHSVPCYDFVWDWVNDRFEWGQLRDSEFWDQIIETLSKTFEEEDIRICLYDIRLDLFRIEHRHQLAKDFTELTNKLNVYAGNILANAVGGIYTVQGR